MITRQGRSVPADDVFEAWTSGDIDRMLGALDYDTNPIDRHFLLLNLCKQAYAARKRDPAMRDLARRVAVRHVEEFPSLVEPLRREMGGFLPRVPTFQNLATLLTEDGAYDEAIAVCEAAMTHKLSDGTKGGFADRIQRIRRKAEKNASGRNSR
jgi:hypothetical protein